MAQPFEDDLLNFLIDHKLQEIYLKLHQKNISLKDLKSTDDTDIVKLSASLKLTAWQEIKFKRVVRELYKKKNVETLPLNETQNITFIGNSCVGKTWLIRRLKIGKEPPSNIGYTTTAESTSVKIQIGQSSSNYQLWDTSGQSAYRDTAPLYFNGALAIIVVYDICDVHSFKNVEPMWLQMIESNAKGHDKILILGNKSDLKAKRKVQEKEGRMIAINNNCEYMEVSAKTGENIDLLTTWIHKQTVNRVMRRVQNERAEEQRAILLTPEQRTMHPINNNQTPAAMPAPQCTNC